MHTYHISYQLLRAMNLVTHPLCWPNDVDEETIFQLLSGGIECRLSVGRGPRVFMSYCSFASQIGVVFLRFILEGKVPGFAKDR